ncbi:AAA family ATPase [Candidatus Poriferisodalis sp.]|uniref:AAA family ATPase n=1 Tax=Candidatus Poriferisodalis sp. TaxID=3101277 RepID=UPI003B017352
MTGFFGANSSGKSSLLQLFLLLKQTVQSPDASKILDLGGDSNALVSVGGWRNLVFGRSSYQSVEFGFRWVPSRISAVDIPEVDDFLVMLPTLAFNTELRVWPDSAFLSRLNYESDQFDVKWIRRHALGDQVRVSLEATRNDKENFLRRLEGAKPGLPAPIHCYGFPNELVGRFENADFLRDLHLELEQQFEKRLFYLGPHRDRGQRRYAWQGGRPADVGPSGERTVDALLASRYRGRNNVALLASDGKPEELISVEEQVARMLRDVGLVSEFSVERASEGSELYRVKVQLSRDSVPVDLTDVGFGVSQLLPLLVLLAYVPEGSTLLLEQPEMHLHPRIQSKLADVLIDLTKTRKLQIILESHSEHLLMRMQRRTAEQEIPHGHVALYFCENNGVESSLSQLQLDECGSIGNWPKDFFGDAMGETAAIVSAGLRHRAETEA